VTFNHLGTLIHRENKSYYQSMLNKLYHLPVVKNQGIKNYYEKAVSTFVYPG